MIKKHPLYHLVPLILLAAAITFSPRFPIGAIHDASPGIRLIDIRFEDLLIAVLAIHWLITLITKPKARFKKPPLVHSIGLLVGLGIITSLINFITRPDPSLVKIFFFSLKEIEYFFIFYFVFYHVRSLKDSLYLIHAWIIFIWFHLFYIFYQVANNIQAWYGPEIIGEYGPFNITGQFVLLGTLTITFYLFYVLKTEHSYVKKIIYALLCITPIIGILTPVERIGVLALVVILPLLCILYLIKVKDRKIVVHLGILLVVILATISIVFSSSAVLQEGVQRKLANIPSYVSSYQDRAGIWSENINIFLSTPFSVIIGRGIQDPLTESSHNQYIFTFIGRGIIGSILFFILIANIIKAALMGYLRERSPLKVTLAVTLLLTTVGMLVVSLTGEPFKVVRIAEHYWYFAGLAFAVLYHKEPS